VCIQACAFVYGCYVLIEFCIGFLGVDSNCVEYVENVIIVKDKECDRAYGCIPNRLTWWITM
jgi:hypothetical protein